MFQKVAVFLLFSLLSLSIHAEALRVGMSPDYPPLQYKQDDRVVGVEADNARAVAEILGRPLAIFEFPFDELIPALEQGRIDVIMSGFSVTAERSRLVMFTDPYLQVGQMAIMHKDKLGQFSQPWSVFREGVRIGVEPGTTGAGFAERELKDAVVVNVADSAEAFEALRADRIDLYVHDAPTSWALANSTDNQDLISLYSPLTQESLAWAVRPGDHKLLGELNQALGLMRKNGTLTYILNRWIPVQVEVR